jgi:hypothetical protein
MRADSPPAIATWFLDHLCAERDEALAGDLVEEYFDGRSAGWYWRQVMAAIAIGGAQRVRACWPAVMFAALWTVLSPGLRYVQIRLLDDDAAAMQRIWRLDGPWSTRFDTSLDILAFLSVIWLGVAVYVALDSCVNGRFSGSRFVSQLVSRLVRALMLVLPTLAAIGLIAALVSAAIPENALAVDWGSAVSIPLSLKLAHGPYSMVFFATAIPLIFTTVRRGRRGNMAIHG